MVTVDVLKGVYDVYCPKIALCTSQGNVVTLYRWSEYVCKIFLCQFSPGCCIPTYYKKLNCHWQTAWRIYANAMVWRTSQKHPPTCVTAPNLVVLGLTVYAYVAQNPQNWGLLRPCCVGMDGVAGQL